MKTEIVPLLIMMELDQFHYTEATVIAVMMLVVSLILLFLIDGLQRWENSGASLLKRWKTPVRFPFAILLSAIPG